MHSCIFNHPLTRFSDGLHYLILCLQARPFSVLVRESTSPPIKFTTAFCSGRNLPIIVFFRRVYFNTLDFFCAVFSAMPVPYICLKTPLLMIFLRLNISNVIEGGSKIVRESFQFFPRKPACLPRLIYLGVSALLLSLGIQPSDRSYGGAYPWGLLLVPQFLVMTEASKFL